MANKSIVDRVLMLAAAVCAAALAWQLTVLLTSKRDAPSPHMAAVATAPASTSGVSRPPASGSDGSMASPVRIVYPGADTAVKTSVKAGDALTPSPPTPAHPSPSTAFGSSVVTSEPTARSAPVGALTSLQASPAEVPQGSGFEGQAPSAGLGSALNPPDLNDTDQTGQTVPAAPSTEMATAEPPAPAASAPAAAVPDGAVDLNHASVEALNHLRGAGRIGLAIVSHRPYHSVEDLVRKRVLRRNVFEQIKQQVVTQ